MKEKLTRDAGFRQRTAGRKLAEAYMALKELLDDELLDPDVATFARMAKDDIGRAITLNDRT